MTPLKIYPALDFLDGKVVRLKKGEQDAVTEFPIAPFAHIESQLNQGAERVHVVDLTRAFAAEEFDEAVFSPSVKATTEYW